VNASCKINIEKPLIRFEVNCSLKMLILINFSVACDKLYRLNTLVKNILFIEDDPQVQSFVKKGLEEEGFKLTIESTGEEGIRTFNQGTFDLIILDIMLPGIGGVEVCKTIRKQSLIPILLLTALGTAENVAIGLNSGADDYLTKPFKFIEFTARINSLLRRASHQEIEVQDILTFEDLTLNNTTKEVKRGETRINLTSTEYKLLKLFLQNPGKVLSRTQMLEKVWGLNFDIGTNVVDVYVNYLRKKIAPNSTTKIIHTVIGMGYVLRTDKHTSHENAD